MSTLGFNNKERVYRYEFKGGEFHKADKANIPYGYVDKAENCRVDGGMLQRHRGFNISAQQISSVPTAGTDYIETFKQGTFSGLSFNEIMVFQSDNNIYVMDDDFQSGVPTIVASGVTTTVTDGYKPSVTNPNTIHLIAPIDDTNVNRISITGGPSWTATQSTITQSSIPYYQTKYRALLYWIVKRNGAWELETSDTISGLNASDIKDIEYGEGEERFTGFKADTNNVYIFTPDCIFIYRPHGRGVANWYDFKTHEGTGCISRDTLKEFEGFYYFADRKGVYRWRGGLNPPKMIYDFKSKTEQGGDTTPVVDTTLGYAKNWYGSINKAQRKYRLFCGSDSSNTLDQCIEINIDPPNFSTILTMGGKEVSAVAEFENRTTFTLRNTATIYQFNLGTDSNLYQYSSQGFTQKVTTGVLDFNDPLRDKQLTVLDLVINADTNAGDVKVLIGNDFTTPTSGFGSISASNSGNLSGDFSDDTGSRSVVKSLNIVDQSSSWSFGRYFQLEFQASGTGNTALYGLNTYYKYLDRDIRGIR